MAKIGKRIMQLVMAGEEMGHGICRLAALYSKVHYCWFLRSLLRIVLAEYIEKREQVGEECGKDFWDIEAFIENCIIDAERREELQLKLKEAGLRGACAGRALLTGIEAKTDKMFRAKKTGTIKK